MAYLRSNIRNIIPNLTEIVGSARLNKTHLTISAGLKAIIGNVASNPMAERLGEAAMNATNLAFKALSNIPAKKAEFKLHQNYPGFITVYANGNLEKIIPLQFEAKVTSDSRTSDFEDMPFGVNKISTFKGTPLRSIDLTTYYPTLDPYLYSSSFVEQRVRELQSLVYAEDNLEQVGIEDNSFASQRIMSPPPIIGLFIGEKFMRRRLPRMVFQQNGEGANIVVEESLKKNANFSNSYFGRPLEEMLRYFLLREPIYWRVDSVTADWSDYPANINFEEFGGNGLPAGSGESKLPMIQKVSMKLTEHRPANTYERRSDVDSFVNVNNIVGRYFL